MGYKNNEQIPNSKAIFYILAMTFALAPQVLHVMYPNIYILSVITERPAWYLYLIFHVGLVILIEKLIFGKIHNT